MPGPNNDSNRPSDAAPAGQTNPHQRPAGGLGAWLPLIITVLAMPILAYGTTTFFLVPKVVRALEATSSVTSGAVPTSSAQSKDRQTAALNKMVVNVAGTMGTRFLLSSVTLVGTSPDFKARVEQHRDQLLDLATSALGNKTIADLEKPGARNQLRTELLSIINSAFGGGFVDEIYITELAIQ
jgi:flagellar protein FliL